MPVDEITPPMALANDARHTVLIEPVVEKRWEVYSYVRWIQHGFVYEIREGILGGQLIKAQDILDVAFFHCRFGDPARCVWYVFPGHHTEYQVSIRYFFLIDCFAGFSGQSCGTIASGFGHGALVDPCDTRQDNVVLVILLAISVAAVGIFAEVYLSQEISVVEVVGSWCYSRQKILPGFIFIIHYPDGLSILIT